VKILVTGPRIWLDQAPVETVLRKFPAGTVLVHGYAKGLDTICKYVGESLGFIVRDYAVDTTVDGPWPAAGHFRNARMLRSEHPSVDGSYIAQGLVFALTDELSKGTGNMAEKLRAANPPIEVEEIRWMRGRLRFS